MDQDDPQRRIAGPRYRWAGAGGGLGVTPEQVHTVVFADASRSQGGYHRGEVDAFLERVEATLRDPAAPGALTAADLRTVVFSKPPIGQRGYNEGEVDAFLDRVKIALTRAPDQIRESSIRCLLYRYGGRDQQTPVVAIDVGNGAYRVIDLKSNALMGSASLAAVTAEPLQHYGIPVLTIAGPGVETMTITPHPPPGVWRMKVKSRKPDYLAVDADWLMLAERFGLASDLVDEYTPQNVRDHFLRFIQESGDHSTWTWRTPLVFGLVVLVLACLSMGPIYFAISAALLILAALAWRFKWEL